MPPLSQTIFISDLHLDAQTPELAQSFFQFISQSQPLDALYILGDFFEVWVGDDDTSPFVQSVIQSLRQLTDQGTPIYLMHGNRDFLIKQPFLTASGCQLITDPAVISLYHTSVLLMHGDLLCLNDLIYLKFRWYTRHPIVQTLFLFLPLFLRRKIADKMRKSSRNHTRSRSPQQMDVVQAEVERLMQEKSVQVLVHGHTHHAGTHFFNIGKTTKERYVLGAWHDEANILVWHSDGKRQLMPLKKWLNLCAEVN